MIGCDPHHRGEIARWCVTQPDTTADVIHQPPTGGKDDETPSEACGFAWRFVELSKCLGVNILSDVIVFGYEIHSGLGALFFGNWRGSVRQWVMAITSLREGDDFTN